MPLGDVAETSLGKMLDRGKSRNLPHVPYLRNINVQWGRINTDDLFTMELDAAERERFGVEPGDLLVCEGGEVGRAAIWTEDSGYIAFQKALHRIRSRGDLDLRFLRYLLEHYSKNGVLGKHSTGSTIAHLPQQRIRQILIPLPPMRKQCWIVDFLEDQFALLDSVLATCMTTNRRLIRLQQAELDAKFGLGGTDSNALGELLSGIQAGRSLGSSAPTAGDDEWGIIKVSAMTWGEFRPQENKAIPESLVNPDFEIMPGDLLVSRANTSEYVGAPVLVGQVRRRLLLSDKSLRLQPRDGVDPGWLWRALQAPSARRQISAAATGTKDSMRNISQKSLMSIRLPKVEPDVQRWLAKAYAERSSEIKRIEHAAVSGRIRMDALRRATLAAAYSGKLSDRTSGIDQIEELAGV